MKAKREEVTENEMGYNGITDSMGMNLGKLLEIVRDRKAWCTAVHAGTKNWI